MLSSKLTEVFNSLPPEAQQMFVEKHLAGLLDLMPKEKSKKVLSAATRLQRKYKDAPKLDLRAKRKQIDSLIEELARDAKNSFIKERSNREELLSEIVHCLVSWLNDVWSLVYEHNVNFMVAHNCLIFVAEALMQLSENSALGGCKCSVLNHPVDFLLRNKLGKVVKRFHVLGPQNIDRILLWIWRDLFVSMYATAPSRDKKRIPDFLEDVETVLGVRALERLLYGGVPSDDDDDDDEEEDFEDIDAEENDLNYHDGAHACSDDEGSDYDSDGSSDCSCNFHASYWSERLNKARLPLRDCVEKRLFDIFEVAPSLELNNTLVTISLDVYKTESRIANILAKIAGDTADTLVAALEIYIERHNTGKIASLIKSHSYLLRPRDVVTLQCAVATLHDSTYHGRSLEILEKGLHGCIRSIHATVRSCFVHIEEDTNKKDLVEILKLRSGAEERKERIEQWVERVITPSNGAVNFMAFAAMMVGFPMVPAAEDGDDTDMLNFVDLDQNDPDLDDLRDEYRPNLKAIFEGWNHVAENLKGGAAILAKIYMRAVDIMPWLRGPDVVSEMANRLRERPNKIHVLDALVHLSAFAKLQQKKTIINRTDQKRKASAINSSQTSASAGSSASSTLLTSPLTNAPPHTGPGSSGSFDAQTSRNGGTSTSTLPFPFNLPGNMEDVD